MKERYNIIICTISLSNELLLKMTLVTFLLIGSINGMAQVDKEQKKLEREANEFLYDATEEEKKDDFPKAEADYRKAIALDPQNETGKYNLGNAYYNKTLNNDAMRRFEQAASIATFKPEKHKAFHNLGNTFMNAKQYKEAVEAYKNALRNNPSDDETRYNFALAKKMLEEQQKNGGGENENKDEQEESKEKEEKKDDSGKDQEGDKGDEKENEDKGDNKDENKEGDNKEDNGKPEEKEGEKEQQQAVPGQLSPQQIKNLLEAMNNEEKKVQDKINAKKQKGAKVKSNKDW